MDVIDINLIKSLFENAKSSERLRMHLDMRNTSNDTSQRMLNALLPDTVVPIHQHTHTSETVICLLGRIEEVFYKQIDGVFCETERHLLCPTEGLYGIQIPQGVWHNVIVYEPSVIFEAKDGAYVPANVSR